MGTIVWRDPEGRVHSRPSPRDPSGLDRLAVARAPSPRTTLPATIGSSRRSTSPFDATHRSASRARAKGRGVMKFARERGLNVAGVYNAIGCSSRSLHNYVTGKYPVPVSSCRPSVISSTARPRTSSTIAGFILTE